MGEPAARWHNGGMKRILPLVTVFLLTGLLVWAGNPSAASDARERGLATWESMPQASLRLVGVDGEVRHLMVRVAATPETRGQGMQYLTPDVIREHPIWFVFDPPRFSGWHMHNVALPLDILFVDESGQVIGRQRMEPEQTGYGIDEPIAAALELAAGQADRYGLAPGARITLERP